MSNYPRPVPLAWYFDSSIEAEIQNSFFKSNYIGHSLMVPDLGDYASLPHYNYEELLVHNKSGFSVLSNRCRHKRSLIIDPLHRKNPPRGNTGPSQKLVCPVHAWSYGLDGKNTHTPFFDTLREEIASGGPKKAGLCHPIDLPNTPLENWKNYLFKGSRNIQDELKNFGHSKLFDPNLFDLDDYQFMEWEVTEYDFNWLVFMDVYFDLYHVAPYHPSTFSQLVDTRNMNWEFGPSYSVQVTGYRDSHQGITKEYGYIRTLIDELYKGEKPKHGALWCSIYPNTMIEWYPLMTVCSVVIPTGPNSCKNVTEYYLPKKFAKRGQEILQAQKAAYNQTADEDAEICLTMSDGYYADFKSGIDQRGPDHPHLELGIVKFHDWLRENNSPKLKALDVAPV